MKKNYMVLIGLLVFSVSAYSGNRLDWSLKLLNKELDEQRAEIKLGLKEGTITRPGELKLLVKERSVIISSIQKATKDNIISNDELDDLRRDLITRQENIDKAVRNDRRVDKWAGYVPNNMVWDLYRQDRLIKKQRKNYDSNEINRLTNMRTRIDLLIGGKVGRYGNYESDVTDGDKKIIVNMIKKRMRWIVEYNL
jgi:hypothetical protein